MRNQALNLHSLYTRLRSSAQFRDDPTRTSTLRRKFTQKMNKRFADLKGEIRISIVDNDAFGLKTGPRLFVPASPGQFDFATDAQKIEAFRAWLEEAMDTLILETIAQRTGVLQVAQEPWINEFLREGYVRGAVAAETRLTQLGITPADLGEAFSDVQRILSNPAHLNRLENIFTRNFTNLEGITRDIDTQLSRILSEGLLLGGSPSQIAKDMAERIDVINVKRAQTLTRTAIVKSHHLATVESYRQAGVREVEVLAEFSTAGDDRVCFPAHVSIQVPHGHKSIEWIGEGERVLTRQGIKYVKKKFQRNYTGTFIHIETDDGNLTCTVRHPIWVVGKEWQPASNLLLGDKVICYNNFESTIRRIDKFWVKNRTVYNLEIEDVPEFYANGILVHNCPDCSALEGRIFTLDEIEPMIPVHPRCYDDQTEVLTDSGYKYFWQLSGQEKVQVTNPVTGEQVFDLPEGYIAKHYTGEMLSFYNSHIDLLVTPEHDMAIKTDDMDIERIMAKKLPEIFVIPLNRNTTLDYHRSDIKKVNYDDKVYCVSMPKWHILSVRRNGKESLCGNCRCTTLPVVPGAVGPQSPFGRLI